MRRTPRAFASGYAASLRGSLTVGMLLATVFASTGA